MNCCNLEQDELTAICDSWNEVFENRMRDEWERMRMLATFNMQPYAKRGLNPKDLLPLPWEEKKQAVIQPKEEARKRFEEIVKRLS